MDTTSAVVEDPHAPYRRSAYAAKAACRRRRRHVWAKTADDPAGRGPPGEQAHARGRPLLPGVGPQRAEGRPEIPVPHRVVDLLGPGEEVFLAELSLSLSVCIGSMVLCLAGVKRAASALNAGMSCFWDSIIAKSPGGPHAARPSPAELIQTMKTWNRATPHVRWQGAALTPQQQREHGVGPRHRRPGGRRRYLTSTMDPFLCLLCEMLQTSIENDYNGARIRYDFSPCGDPLCCDPVKAGRSPPLRFRNDRGHMWAPRPTAPRSSHNLRPSGKVPVSRVRRRRICR